ncbi:MAG TPA: His-Xaa-Ser system protein HxsD [Thermoanaerobaculia bacterium]|jgi:His-Xaa-Ser system protein HxsD|nr:His-Xaa-Ser system protein HxsD [Thermoanaerobaculia bacterium]
MNDEIEVSVDTALHSRRAIFEACYRLTDRAYVSLSRDPGNPNLLVVGFRARQGTLDPSIAGIFRNELIDQEIRTALDLEMAPIRDLIVAQAFAEGNLLDSLRDEGDYGEDPLGIGRLR